MVNKDFFYRWHNRKLRKHTEEVDIDAIWAAIEPEVDAINVERKRRRGFLFFLSLACIGIISAGFLSLFFNTSSKSPQHISNSLNTTTLLEKEGTQIDENINNSLTKSQDKVVAVPPSNIHKSKTPTNTVSSQSILSPSLNVKDDRTEENIWRPNGQNSTPKILVEQPLKTNQEHLAVPTTLSLKASVQKISTEDVNHYNRKEDVVIRDEVNMPLPLPIGAKLSPLAIAENDELPTKAVITKEKAPFELSLGLYSGLAIVQRQLNSKVGTESDEALILRRGTERNLELWNNGLRAKVKHKSGLHLSLGLQVARVAEHFQYNTDYVEMDSIANTVIGYSNNLLGDRNAIIGFAENNTQHEMEYDFYNYYYFVDVPVSLGYQKQFRNWNFGLRGAYVQNISLRTKGRVLDNPYTVLDINQKDATPFKSKLAGSFEGGINAGYRISKHLELGIDAFMRHAPKSITKDSYSLDQRYNWIGINTSINYIF